MAPLFPQSPSLATTRSPSGKGAVATSPASASRHLVGPRMREAARTRRARAALCLGAALFSGALAASQALTWLHLNCSCTASTLQQIYCNACTKQGLGTCSMLFAGLNTISAVAKKISRPASCCYCVLVLVKLPNRKTLSMCYQATHTSSSATPGWWLFRTLLVRTEPAAPAPGRTCPAHLDALLARAVSGPLAEPTRTRRRLYEEMGAQLARNGLSLGVRTSLCNASGALHLAIRRCLPELLERWAQRVVAWPKTYSLGTAQLGGHLQPGGALLTCAYKLSMIMAITLHSNSAPCSW